MSQVHGQKCTVIVDFYFCTFDMIIDSQLVEICQLTNTNAKFLQAYSFT